MRARLRQRGVVRPLAPQPDEQCGRVGFLAGKQTRVAALRHAREVRVFGGRAAQEDTRVGYVVERMNNGSGGNDISVVTRRMQS